MVKFSLLLILIAVAILGITLAPALSPNDTTLLNLLEPVLCAPGENLIQQVSPLARSTGNSLTSFITNTTLSCKPTSGELIDVTGKLFGMGLTVFLVFLVFGVIFMIVGVIRNASRRSRQGAAATPAGATPFYTTQPNAAPSSNPFATQVSIPRQPSYGSGYAPMAYATPPSSSQPTPSEKFDFEPAETMMSIPTPTAAPTAPPPSTSVPAPLQPVGSSDLATRLKQLRDALDAGLISQEEFDRSKSNLLHDFTDD